jgi:hypothetical protein
MQRTLLAIRPRSHSHDKISGWRRTNILNSVLVVRTNKSDRTRSHNMTCAIDRELHGTFPNEPDFAVHVVMRRMRRPARR